MSIRDQFASLKPELQVIPVDVEGWPRMYARELSMADISEFSKYEQKSKDMHELTAAFLCFCLCEEDGTPAFQFPNDVKLFMQHPTKKLKALGEEVRKLNSLTLTNVEEAEKN